MKKIIVHIGTFKTGSTSLQHHLALNREVLLENNFYYGDYFENIKAHSNLGYGLLREALQENDVFEKYRDHPRFIHVAEDPEDVIRRIAENSGNCNVIISHEALFADSYRTLIGLDAFVDFELMARINTYIRRRLFGLLSNISNEIQVICYLRRQDLFIESQFNQLCKQPWYSGGQIHDFDKFLEVQPVNLDYYSQLVEWEKIFGGNSIRIKVYDKKLMKKGLIDDFYKDILGISETEKLKNIPRKDENLGLNPQIIMYMKMMNLEDKGIHEILQKYPTLSGYNQKEGFFDHRNRIKFLEKYDRINCQVARHFLNREKLFDDEIEQIPQIKALSYDEFAEITKWLLGEILS